MVKIVCPSECKIVSDFDSQFAVKWLLLIELALKTVEELCELLIFLKFAHVDVKLVKKRNQFSHDECKNHNSKQQNERDCNPFKAPFWMIVSKSDRGESGKHVVEVSQKCLHFVHGM